MTLTNRRGHPDEVTGDWGSSNFNSRETQRAERKSLTFFGHLLRAQCSNSPFL